MHVMIDLETLGTSKRAAVAQLGLCFFDIHTGEVELPLQVDVDPGSWGEIDTSTVMWWMQQSDAAREGVFSTGDAERMLMYSALRWMSSRVLESPKVAGVWSNGSGFDLAILSEASRALGVRLPWPYYAERDQRTLLWTAEALGWARVKRPVAHTAGADARAQAEEVCAAWAHIWSVKHSGVTVIEPHLHGFTSDQK